MSKGWHLVLTVALAIAGAVCPAAQAWILNHFPSFVGLATAWTAIGHFLPGPIVPSLPKTGNKIPLVILALLFAPTLHAHPRPAQTPAPKPSCSHALCKIAGTVIFAAEGGIDAIHGALDVANRGLIAAGPVKILIPVQKIVGVADSGAAFVDTATEHAENYLFGVSN